MNTNPLVLDVNKVHDKAYDLGLTLKNDHKERVFCIEDKDGKILTEKVADLDEMDRFLDNYKEGPA